MFATLKHCKCNANIITNKTKTHKNYDNNLILTFFYCFAIKLTYHYIFFYCYAYNEIILQIACWIK